MTTMHDNARGRRNVSSHCARFNAHGRSQMYPLL